MVLFLLVSKLDLFLGRQRHATSEIVNYIVVDAYRFGEFFMVVALCLELP